MGGGGRVEVYSIGEDPVRTDMLVSPNFVIFVLNNFPGIDSLNPLLSFDGCRVLPFLSLVK